MARPNELSQERRIEILHVAMMHFLDAGFDQTSTDSIARQALTSKATLYKWFGNKQELFEAVIEYASQHHAFSVGKDKASIAGLPLKEFLEEVAYRIVDNIYTETLVNTHRLVISECKRFPKIVDIFIVKGAGFFHERVDDLLSSWHSPSGKESIQDTRKLADALIAYSQGKPYLHAMLGEKPMADEKSKRELAHKVVNTLISPKSLVKISEE